MIKDKDKRYNPVIGIVHRNMYKIRIATAAILVGIFSLLITASSGNAKVICAGKYNYAMVIPCSDENAIDKASVMTSHILTGGGLVNMTSSTATNMLLPVGDMIKKYVPFENLKLGFRILHPFGWHALELSPYDPDYPEIWFGPAGYVESLLNNSEIIAPGSNTSLSIKVDNVSKYLNTNTLTVKNHTAYDYATDRINLLFRGGVREHYIRDMPVAVGPAHIPGWRVDSMYSGLPGVNDGDYVISTYVVASAREYTLTYEDNSLKVPETLPIMQTMLNSFQVIK